MKLEVTVEKPVKEKVEVKHIHRLSNWAIWKWGSCIYGYSGGEILTKDGMEKEGSPFYTVMPITCRICKKNFNAEYNHLRWARMKKTGEYIPA